MKYEAHNYPIKTTDFLYITFVICAYIMPTIFFLNAFKVLTRCRDDAKQLSRAQLWNLVYGDFYSYDTINILLYWGEKLLLNFGGPQ